MPEFYVPIGGGRLLNGYAALLIFAALALAAYLCGCLNGAVIVSKYILRDDIRDHGSGNAGLTNFYRTFGGKLTAVVLLLDMVKMVVAVWLATAVVSWLVTPNWMPLVMGIGTVADRDLVPLMTFTRYWAGLFCLLGHMFPVTFGFKGGKGILSGGALAILIDWRLALLVWGGFLLLVLLTRFVSLGSIYAAAAFPVGTWLFVSRDPVILTLSVALGGLVIWMHRGNIRRLLKGEESKFSLHRKKN